MIVEAALIIILAFVIAALPLHIAIRMLGGKSSILKAIFVNILVGIVTAVIYTILPFATIISFIALIWVYREMFRLKWFKAFLAWIIQTTLTFIFILLFTIIFGISLVV